MTRKIKDGDKFGEWTVIKAYSSNVGKPKKSLCRCSCGFEKEVNNYDLLYGRTKSCGHAKGANIAKTRYKKTDKKFIGKTFGELTVIERVNDKGRARYKCKCSCGKEVEVIGSNLERGYQVSCGDYRIHRTQEHFDKFMSEGRKKLDDKLVEDTNLYILNSGLSKRNTSGCRGVYLVKKTGHYKATINFQKQCIYLGTFKTFDEAVEARKAAEEKYYKPILEKYKDRLDD